MLDLAPIQARAQAATPGPWEWAQDRINSTPLADGSRRRRKWDLWVYVLKRATGRDWEDASAYENSIMALSWGLVRGRELVNATPIPADAAFIAHAREDVPALVAEVERLRSLTGERGD